MTNIEKHENVTEEQIDRANSSAVPVGAGAALMVGRYVRDHRNGGSARASAPDGRPFGVILRFEDLRATPPNIERIRERVRVLNRHPAASGTPLRLRVVSGRWVG
jgi:hypothetical protein